MSTTTFARDCHIEELRAELRATLDTQEASDIRAELEKLQANRDSLAAEQQLAV